MGPMEALVELAKEKGLSPFSEELVATTEAPLVGVYLQDNGRATVKPLKPGTKVRGYVNCSRTSGPRPRPFRDNAQYTALPGKERTVYAEVVGRMVERHPRNQALRAFHKFLTSRQRLRVYEAEKSPTGEGRKKKGKGGKQARPTKDALYIPFYKGRLVFNAIAKDLEDPELGLDPYGHERGRVQEDVVTGETCIVPRARPLRLTELGSSKGVTLMSVDDRTTGMHGWLGKKYKHLGVPVSQSTMNLHVMGLRWLIHHGQVLWPAWGNRLEAGAIFYGGWCPGQEGPERTIMAVLNGLWPPRNGGEHNPPAIKLPEVERFAKAMRGRKEPFCLVGIREDKRISFVSWHELPLHEVAENVLDYARRFHLDDGRVIGLRDVARAAVSLDELFKPSGEYVGAKDHNEAAYRRCRPEYVMALVDHIIEGLPFPVLLRNHVRQIYGARKILHTNVAAKAVNTHLDVQEMLLDP